MNKRKAIYDILSVFNRVVSKNNTIVIYGGKYLDDNSEAMFRYLLENTSYKIICLADKTMNYKLRRGVKIAKCTYFRTIWRMLRSKVVIDSSYHTIKMEPTKKQLFVNCWHGSPLKRMHDNGTLNNSNYYSKLFYGSDIFKEHMQSYFNATKEKMYLAGNPRNDYLFDDLSLPDELNFRGKKVIWMPTFRNGIGRIESNKNIPVLTKDNIRELAQVLQENNICLFIKAHRLQTNGFEELIAELDCDNIRLISDELLCKHNIPLYSFVGKMDALLTDYSSIFYDFLLVNRPIGFVIDDIDQYMKNRGFAFENPLDYMPGQKIYDFKELVTFLYDLSDDKDKYSTSRREANNKFNYFTDNRNCERCALLIKDFIENGKNE